MKSPTLTTFATTLAGQRPVAHGTAHPETPALASPLPFGTREPIDPRCDQCSKAQRPGRELRSV